MASRIERGMTVEGSIRGEGELEVAGRIRGALTLAGKLIVEQGGIVEADVEATDIEVAGLLAGSATAHNTVQVIAGGRVEARIKAPRLMVSEGGLFRGELVSQTPEGGALTIERTAPSRAALPTTTSPGPRARPSSMTAVDAPVEPTPRPRAEPASAARKPFAAPVAAEAPRAEGAREGRGRPGHAPSTAPRRGPEGPVQMPMLPRGRTRLRTRGGEP